MRLDAWNDDRDDRRAAPRRSTKVDAQLEHPGGVLHGRIVDMSFGGAKFITEVTEPALESGCQVTLIVAPHGEMVTEELRWSGAVVRNERSGDDGPPRIAYGIAFDETEPRPFPGLDDLD